jgi:hypothetical protein
MAAMMAMMITARPPTTPPMIGAIGVFALDPGTCIDGAEGVGGAEGVDKGEVTRTSGDSEGWDIVV